jgi:RNA-splicing ligase RtcB
MLTYKGKYNEAVVYTDNIEETAASQLIELCSQEFMSGSKVRVIPDVHAGKGCVVGTTLTIGEKIVPNLVGVDIGCGMHTVKLDVRADEIDLAKLDKTIKKFVPLGTSVRNVPFLKYYNQIKDEMESMASAASVDLVRAKLSMGSLGGGNHFIELDVDDDGYVYLVIHTGSRKAGTQVCEFHQDLAYKLLKQRGKEKSQLVDLLNSQGRQKEIQAELKKLAPVTNIPKALAYLEADHLTAYLNDMGVMQKYADLNRKAIAETITVGMRWKTVASFSTIHNYIDLETMILRKGAISAQEGELVLIPMNNEDGSLICTGKGNPDWNFSAPHGAGRLMSRSKAKASLSLELYQQGLKDAGVYTTTANQSTLDESKQAYKPIDEIIANIGDTVNIVKRIKPIFNIKAGDED